MNILQSFRINHPVKLAAVGAGGKSSFLFALAREINGKCIITTTTHISIEQSYWGDVRLSADDPLLCEKIESAPDNAVIVIVGLEQGRERVNGPDEAIFTKLIRLCEKEKISILIEADGSKKLSLKAFEKNEPAVPSWVDLVVHVIGCSVIGKQVNKDNVFRVDRYCELTNQKLGERINFQSIVKLLLHEDGGRKAINNDQRSVIFFNQFPTNLVIDQTIESQIYALLSYHHSVIFGNINSGNNQSAIDHCYENIAAVILAAGGSARLGENNIKQLLQINGKSFLENTIELSLERFFINTFVVLGYKYDQLKSEIKALPIDIIRNQNWENGQSTSVIAAVNELLKIPHLGGVLFIPIDQPYLDTETINCIVRCHTKNTGSAIVPRYKKVTGAPVLFDHNQLEHLLSLHGDKGGRSILHQVQHTFCDIENNLALMDIDTMEDYEKLIDKNH